MGCITGLLGFGVIAFVVAVLWEIHPALGIISIIALVILAVFGSKSEGQQKPDTPPRPEPTHDQTPETPTQEQHYPARPSLPPFDVGKARGEVIEVVGEYYRQDAFHKIIALNVLEYTGDRYSGRGTFLLTDDSTNPYDSNAIALWFAGEHIGYLSRQDARRYRPVIDRATQLGYTLATSGYIWIGVRSGFNPRAEVWLPQPHLVLPVNDMPAEAVFLPTGAKIQVTKEEDHMDVLTRWVKKTHGQATILFTLKAIQDVRSRTVVDIVQVCIGDEPIGILTKGMSEKLVPLVEYVEERAKTPVVYGELTGNSIKCEAAFWCARANDVSEQWLASLGPKKVRVRHERPEPMWDDEDLSEPPATL